MSAKILTILEGAERGISWSANRQESRRREIAEEKEKIRRKDRGTDVGDRLHRYIHNITGDRVMYPDAKQSICPTQWKATSLGSI